jgi:hypothetical protein
VVASALCPHPNVSLIERFHSSLSARDGAVMAGCYAIFEDPAFGRLDAEYAGAMWRMLTSGRRRDR